MESLEDILRSYGVESIQPEYDWLAYAAEHKRTPEQDSWYSVYQRNVRDGSEFVNEEIRISVLLDAAAREIDVQAVDAFSAMFDGLVDRLEPALAAADDVMRRTWDYVDEDRVAAAMKASVNRGGLINAAVDNIADNLPRLDDVTEGMVRASRYFTNNHFNRVVMPAMRKSVDRLVLGDQLDAAKMYQVTRELLAARLQSTPYWRLVGNQAASRAYHYGAMQGASAVGYRAYRIVTVPDDRRTDVCREMHGRTFQVADGLAHMERVALSEDEDIKDISPWVKLSDIEGVDSSLLSERGVLIPPFHANCRSTIVLQSA